jgi:methylenetetrahydrofolate reductase (NADPH)
MTSERLPADLERRLPWLGRKLPPVELSFEFFPPKNEAGLARLRDTVERVRPLEPHFVSVTCGAGGGSRAGTAEAVAMMRKRYGLQAAAHLTCANTPRSDIDEAARAYWDEGVRHIVALRGDPPKGAERYVPHPDGYPFAVDLVKGLRAIADFEISVACYPETHPEAPSPEADIDNVKRKVDAGASRVITQYCFDTERMLRYRDALRAAGIEAPFAAGVIPIHDFNQIRRFSEGCGAGVPDWLAELFAGLDDDPEQRQMVAATVAAEQCRRLVVEGVQHLHVYTLNRAELTVALCRLLGLGDRLRDAA